MFFSNDMSRVTVVAHKAHMKKVIEALYDANVLHLKEYMPREGDYYPIGEPLENAEKISELLLLLNAIKTQISLNQNIKKSKEELNLEKFEKFLNDFKHEMDGLNAEIKKTEDTLKANGRKKEILRFLKETKVNRFDMLKGYGSLEVISGYVADAELLKENMNGIDYEILNSDEKGAKGFSVVLFIRIRDMEKARDALQRSNFTRLDTGMEWKSANVAEEEAHFNREMAGLEKSIATLRKEYAKLTDENSGELLGIEDTLTEEIKKSEAPLKFAVSGHSFIIQGWVPTGKHEALEKNLASITNNMYFQVEEVEQEEAAPVLLTNKGPVKPFEFFLRLYSLPKYKEVDPTFILFITYPILFGIMMGDIGYGIVLFAGFAFIKYRMKKMRSLASVLMVSSLASILFGFVFGEFFGFEAIAGYELHPLILRAEGINAMLPIALILGIVHLNIGISISLVNELRERKYRHALGKASWFIVQTGGILYLLATFFKMPIGVDPMISLYVLIVGVVLLTIGESYRGLIEIPALASNVLSYARLAALGLAGVQLALIINGMAEGMFQTGGVFFILGIGLLFAGHAVNTLLSLMGCFLQSLRLHYVEMFSKFYHGDGEPYKPFGSS